MEEKQNEFPDRYAKAPDTPKSVFDSKEHRREEREYEKYYNRIRMLSRGLDLTS